MVGRSLVGVRDHSNIAFKGGRWENIVFKRGGCWVHRPNDYVITENLSGVFVIFDYRVGGV